MDVRLDLENSSPKVAALLSSSQEAAMKIKALILCLAAFALNANLAQAKSLLIYEGLAKNSEGELVYKEIHNAVFNKDGKIVSSETKYYGPDKKSIGHLKSDFRDNLTTPSYLFKNFQKGEENGLTQNKDSWTLFRTERDKEKETKVIKSDFDKDAMIVGCQGLHYYLKTNIRNIDLKKLDKEVKFLIPGSLDYYTFDLKYVSETEDTVTLKMNVSSIILRIFAPSLDMVYDKKTGNLLRYEGFSNITDKDGDIQNVTITYNYPAASSKGKIQSAAKN